jgi:Cof subfamily protein (haloacid dehalogenase superfamily)
MKKFDKFLICTDLDGTLLCRDKTVSRENLEAIEYFKQNGGIFTFVTGRMPYMSRQFYDAVKPNSPIGCINGAGVYDFERGQYLYRRELERESLELVEHVHQHMTDMGIHVNTFFAGYFCQDNDGTEYYRKRSGAEHLVCRLEDIDEPIAKVLFMDTCEENFCTLDAVLRSHPLYDRFDYVRSDRILFELIPKGIGKGDALLRLADAHGIPQENTVAIGDYNNDIDMIKKAGLGVAVENATPDVLEVADLVTVSNENHAIARVIEYLEAHVIRKNK